MELTPVPGAEPRYDDDGNEIVDVMTCGTCGRSWNDAAVSSMTPTPSGRCPFEYDHEPEQEDDDYHDVTYTVTLTIRDDADGDPDPAELAKAIYQGVRDVDTEDAVSVERED